MENIKKEYENLKKKYNLPSFKDLDKEFEIRLLELNKCGIPIKALLRIINNKVGLFLSYIEPVISPHPQSIHFVIESKHIEEEDKKAMFEFYKELSCIYHKNCLIELSSEKEIANQINEIWKKWPSITKRMKTYLKKISESWNKEREKTRTSYTG